LLVIPFEVPLDSLDLPLDVGGYPKVMKDESLTWLTRSSSLSSSTSCSSCFHARACESQKQVRDENVVESKTVQADASSIDRDDERLKRDEIRHSDECSRWVCMGLV
jgi:hypothetical protein